MAAKAFSPTDAFHLTVTADGIVNAEITDEEGDSIVIELDATQAGMIGADFLKKGLAASIIAM